MGVGGWKSVRVSERDATWLRQGEELHRQARRRGCRGQAHTTRCYIPSCWQPWLVVVVGSGGGGLLCGRVCVWRERRE